MKKYRWVFIAVFTAALAGISGCGKKTETIPITTISQSTDDDDPEDNMTVSGDSDEIPEYDVELSKDLNSFQLAIWGDTYEIPESYADFTALGWVYNGDDTKEIQPESFSEGESFEKDGNRITVDIANPDTTTKPVSECRIGGIHIDTSTPEGQNIYVSLPNGVILQQSLMDETENIYGAPKDRYETDTSVQFTYEYGLYQTITLGFDAKTGILFSLDMQNFTTTADTEALDDVSDATTPEVEAYTAPENDSSEINDWTVRFDDVLYHLPVPVNELLSHDWVINAKESDSAVLNGKYGYVTLEKGSQKLYCTVHNYGTEATTVRNCFVTSLYGDLDTTKIPISITNGITLGTSESDFLAKAGDAKSEKTEKEDSNLTLYTFYSGDEKLDYTEIGIDNDLKLVRSIKVVHNQPELPDPEESPDTQKNTDSEKTSAEPGNA